MKLAAIVLLAMSAQAAEVTGIILDHARRPLRAVTVWAHIRPDAGSRPKPFSAWAVTDDRGVYRISGLPEGSFSLCPETGLSGLVDPCVWGDPGPAFRTGADDRVTASPLVLARGFPLRVRFGDPAGELARREDGVRAPFAGVRSRGGMFVPLRLVYQEPRGREYEVIAPYQVALTLLVNGAAWRLTDSRGQTISQDGGAVIPIFVRPGKTPPIFYFRIGR